MFTFVSAFPKTLHCNDEAQQAETVLSAVLSIYIYIFMYISKNQRWRQSYTKQTGDKAWLETYYYKHKRLEAFRPALIRTQMLGKLQTKQTDPLHTLR